MLVAPDNAAADRGQYGDCDQESVGLHVGYLRFHQTANPERTTMSGRNTTLESAIMFSWRTLSMIRRSSGSFSGIEMSDSSAVSQLTMLSARSRLAVG